MTASDVTSSDNCKMIIEKHMKEFGKLNVLVNNSKHALYLLLIFKQLEPRLTG